MPRFEFTILLLVAPRLCRDGNDWIRQTLCGNLHVQSHYIDTSHLVASCAVRVRWREDPSPSYFLLGSRLMFFSLSVRKPRRDRPETLTSHVHVCRLEALRMLLRPFSCAALGPSAPTMQVGVHSIPPPSHHQSRIHIVKPYRFYPLVHLLKRRTLRFRMTGCAPLKQIIINDSHDPHRDGTGSTANSADHGP